MTKSKKPEAAPETSAPGLSAAMMAVNPVAAKAWMDIMSESAGFVMNRLQSDLETQRALMACKSPDELMKVQSEFFRTAMEQYSGEAARMFKMMTQAAEDTVEDVKTGHKRGYDNIPL